MSTEPQSKKQKRFTAQRKQEVVLRLLKVKPIELLSLELNTQLKALTSPEVFITLLLVREL